MFRAISSAANNVDGKSPSRGCCSFDFDHTLHFLEAATVIRPDGLEHLISVHRGSLSTGTVTFLYTISGTAQGGGAPPDYTINGTVADGIVFADGELTKDISITTTLQATPAADKTIVLTLLPNSVNGDVVLGTPSTTTVSIRTDPQLAVSSAGILTVLPSNVAKTTAAALAPLGVKAVARTGSPWTFSTTQLKDKALPLALTVQYASDQAGPWLDFPE